MNPETLYFVAVGLCGIGLLCVAGVSISLARKVRRLEAKLEDIPRRFKTSEIKGVRGGPMIFDEGTEAHLVDEIKAAARRLPKGRGLT